MKTRYKETVVNILPSAETETESMTVGAVSERSSAPWGSCHIRSRVVSRLDCSCCTAVSRGLRLRSRYIVLGGSHAVPVRVLVQVTVGLGGLTDGFSVVLNGCFGCARVVLVDGSDVVLGGDCRVDGSGLGVAGVHAKDVGGEDGARRSVAQDSGEDLQKGVWVIRRSEFLYCGRVFLFFSFMQRRRKGKIGVIFCIEIVGFLCSSSRSPESAL